MEVLLAHAQSLSRLHRKYFDTDVILAESWKRFGLETGICPSLISVAQLQRLPAKPFDAFLRTLESLAKDVFGGPEFQRSYPEDENKVRLLLFWMDSSSRMFKGNGSKLVRSRAEIVKQEALTPATAIRPLTVSVADPTFCHKKLNVSTISGLPHLSCVDSVLLDLFVRYCSFGDRLNTGKHASMTSAKFLKFSRDAGVLEHVPSSSVDIVFKRACGAGAALAGSSSAQVSRKVAWDGSKLTSTKSSRRTPSAVCRRLCFEGFYSALAGIARLLFPDKVRQAGPELHRSFVRSQGTSAAHVAIGGCSIGFVEGAGIGMPSTSVLGPEAAAPALHQFLLRHVLRLAGANPPAPFLRRRETSTDVNNILSAPLPEALRGVEAELCSPSVCAAFCCPGSEERGSVRAPREEFHYGNEQRTSEVIGSVRRQICESLSRLSFMGERLCDTDRPMEMDLCNEDDLAAPTAAPDTALRELGGLIEELRTELQGSMQPAERRSIEALSAELVEAVGSVVHGIESNDFVQADGSPGRKRTERCRGPVPSPPHELFPTTPSVANQSRSPKSKRRVVDGNFPGSSRLSPSSCGHKNTPLRRAPRRKASSHRRSSGRHASCLVNIQGGNELEIVVRVLRPREQPDVLRVVLSSHQDVFLHASVIIDSRKLDALRDEHGLSVDDVESFADMLLFLINSVNESSTKAKLCMDEAKVSLSFFDRSSRGWHETLCVNLRRSGPEVQQVYANLL